MRSSRLIILLLVLFTAQKSNGQTKNRDYPEGIFQFPINPKQTNYLSGTMGELRGNHFHSGIDIKTYGKTGLPIYAIADGYVSRIRVSPYGYGKALYVTHPKIGYTSVYAHCKKFSPKINAYVQQKQYEKETFSIQLYPSADVFKVKKGDLIAYSGNTGGSFGPHLHFEIRDIFQNVLNPLFFKFKEIKDNIPPSILKLKFVPLTIESRINGKFEPITVEVKRSGSGKYYISETPNVQGLVGIEIKTYDQLNGASNKNGVSSYKMTVDNKSEYVFFMESFSFDQTRYLNRHVDYEEHHHHKNWLQKCFLDDGNMLELYEYNSNKGKIYVIDEKTHNISIAVKDAYLNTSMLNFKVQGSTRQQNNGKPSVRSSTTKIDYDLVDNTLKVIVKDPKNYTPEATFYTGKKEHTVDVSHISSNKAVFLWDLRKGLPDSITTCHQSKTFYFTTTIPSGKKMIAYSEFVDIYFPRSAVYDTLYLEIECKDDKYRINNPDIPLYTYIHVTIDPMTPVTNTDKTRVYSYNSKGRLVHEGGTWDGKKIKFKTRSLGTYTLKKDTQKPRISRLKDNGNSIRFKVSDNLSGISTYRATVDGKFLLMNYNYKTGVLWSERINESNPIKGKLKLVLTDQVGNQNIYETQL